jgi:anti-anti-sigma regulatory factor
MRLCRPQVLQGEPGNNDSKNRACAYRRDLTSVLAGDFMTKDISSTTRPVSKNVHVDLYGEISLADVAHLRDWMLQAQDYQQALLIDCVKVTYFDTSALQFLASLRVEARALGVPLQFQGLPGSVLANAAPRGNALDGIEQRMTG